MQPDYGTRCCAGVALTLTLTLAPTLTLSPTPTLPQP